MYLLVALWVYRVKERMYLQLYCLCHCTTHFLKNQPYWPHKLFWGIWALAQRSCSLPAGQRDTALLHSQLSSLACSSQDTRDWFFTKHTQAMSEAPVCLTRTAEEKNKAGIQDQQSQDCETVPLWRDWSSWKAPSVPVALPICPTVPHICSAPSSVISTTC